VDPNDGSTTAYDRPAGTPFFNTADMRRDGLLYGLQGGTLYRVDFSTGSSVATEVVALAGGGGEIAFDPADRLFVANGSTLRQVEIATGQTSSSVPVKHAGSPLSLQGIDFSPGGVLYGVDGDSLYTIDPSSGAAARVTPSGSTAGNPALFTALDYGDAGVLRGVLFSLSQPLWQIDPSTGLGSPFHGAMDGVPFSSIATIPEPSTLTLAALGLLGLAMIGRRRKRWT